MRRNLLIVLKLIILIILLYTFYYNINAIKLLRIEIKELERIVEEQYKDIEKLKLTNEKNTESISNESIVSKYVNKDAYNELAKQVSELQYTIKYFDDYQQFRCYINSFDTETGEILVDQIEWLSFSDKERREELNLGDEVVYLYNEVEENIKYYTDDDTILEVLKDASTQVEVDINEFKNRIDSGYYPVHEMTIVNGRVVKVSECYLP